MLKWHRSTDTSVMQTNAITTDRRGRETGRDRDRENKREVEIVEKGEEQGEVGEGKERERRCDWWGALPS